MIFLQMFDESLFTVEDFCTYFNVRALWLLKTVPCWGAEVCNIIGFSVTLWDESLIAIIWCASIKVLIYAHFENWTWKGSCGIQILKLWKNGVNGFKKSSHIDFMIHSLPSMIFLHQEERDITTYKFTEVDGTFSDNTQLILMLYLNFIQCDLRL